jgi:hypothetical protein
MPDDTFRILQQTHARNSGAGWVRKDLHDPRSAQDQDPERFIKAGSKTDAPAT